MKQLDQQNTDLLNRHYRAASATVLAFLAATIVLTIIAALIAGKVQPFGAVTGEASFSVDNLTNPNNAGGATATTFLWITILALAVAAFLLRRAIFAAQTLRDAATLHGVGGLLASLQNKTVLIASFGLIAAILGFVIALMSGSWFDMLRAAAIAAIVLFVSFPRKVVWQRLANAAAK